MPNPVTPEQQAENEARDAAYIRWRVASGYGNRARSWLAGEAAFNAGWECHALAAMAPLRARIEALYAGPDDEGGTPCWDTADAVERLTGDMHYLSFYEGWNRALRTALSVSREASSVEQEDRT